MYRQHSLMIRAPALILVALLCLATPVSGQQQAAHESARSDMLSRQLDHLLASLHGDWGNMDQFFFQHRLGVEAASRRTLVHVSIVPVEMEGVTDHTPGRGVFSQLRISAGDGSQEILDQRLLEHQIDRDSGDLISHIRSFGGELHDCRVIWRLNGGQYLGRQSGSQCPDWGEGTGEMALTVSKGDLWVARKRQQDLSVADRYVSELRLRQARMFTCRINVILTDEGQMDFGQLRVQRFDTWTDLRLHDQGGEVWITTNDSPARRLGLRLHHVVWPFGDSAPSRGLFLLNADVPDDGRGIAYASSSPDSVRLALSNREISASCFMDVP